jgi:1-deoxy-D-xylulose-5-phosphate synthase
MLPELCSEIRAEIIKTCAAVGGHLGGSLGAVELVVALHRAFDTPRDLVLFDTGHQAYAHKVITGRRGSLGRLRQEDGLAGFLERAESPYDAFGAGHASTGMSAALGLAQAAALRGEPRRVAVVVGDGALTGGLAFEALNNIGASALDLVIVLNDNGMSIAPNVGGVARMLRGERPRRARLTLHAAVEAVRQRNLGGLGEVLPAGPREFFTSLGVRYFGPVDGHDLEALAKVMSEAKAAGGPVVIHAKTQKGKGFGLAEADAGSRGHSMGPFDEHLRPLKKSSTPTFTDVFADALSQIMGIDDRVVAITAAMPDGTGLARVARQFPDRVFDVGIAEGHAVTFAAGLAAGGMRPVCALYSTFLQRGLDQLIHDVCLQKLPVTFAIDRAGLVGGDGATHQGSFDIAYLRAIPNLLLMAPSDENELRHLLMTALTCDGPAALRYPRGAGPGAKIDPAPAAQPIGRSRLFLRTAVRPDATLLALGDAVSPCVEASRLLGAEGFKVDVVDARFIKPLDEEMILSLADRPLITVEHHVAAAGFGSAVLELVTQKGLPSHALLRLGFPDRFIRHGDPVAQYAQLGLDGAGIARSVRELLGPAALAQTNT